MDATQSDAFVVPPKTNARFAADGNRTERKEARRRDFLGNRGNGSEKTISETGMKLSRVLRRHQSHL